MSQMDLHMKVDDPQIFPARLGKFLRERASAKEITRIADCDIRTAENIRRGQNFPLARHWIGLIATFGEDLTEAVFHPEKAAARLARECSELERQLEKTRAALRDMAGDTPRLAQGRARHEDGSAP